MVTFERIDTVFLPVRDLSKALVWYADTLGFDIAWQNECVGSLTAGETALSLLQYGYPGYPTPPDGFVFEPNRHVSFNLYVEDIEQVHRLLREKGVSVRPISDHGQVKDFLFEDLDGNLLSVVSW
ncbi:hypothetical protein CAI21_11980 [Alkalilimnicola ehrlichii]|uniref:VOC domain-containing protein n=1 Tax=Alkalilimnicola ehrlichii TaxID=351052 RepID=A0A3E0WTM0_9GAMM|nr:VOC family protein [Alkalilimnicola ehrlichii]RFA28575.1 hypothetical protein CAI21_11980 [Alkalilimnicola ehrlichii]RFA35739.1 hypothetical protein CAL65_12500 [Alkalilimnicola ehrlichii]